MFYVFSGRNNFYARNVPFWRRGSNVLSQPHSVPVTQQLGLHRPILQLYSSTFCCCCCCRRRRHHHCHYCTASSDLYNCISYHTKHIKLDIIRLLVYIHNDTSTRTIPGTRLRVTRTSEVRTSGAFAISRLLKIWCLLWNTLNALQMFIPLSLVMMYITVDVKIA